MNDDDFVLSAVVAPCMMTVIPPPAMIANIHFTDGSKSVITDAVAIVPVIIETGCQVKVPVPGGKVKGEERDKHPESAGCTQSYASNDREYRLH